MRRHRASRHSQPGVGSRQRHVLDASGVRLTAESVDVDDRFLATSNLGDVEFAEVDGDSQAIERVHQIAPFGIELVEQPCATLDEMAEVARSVEVSIAGDESIASETDATAARRKGACELATAKLAKVGGIGQAHGLAEAIPTYLSSALDGPVGIAAAAHGAQALYRDRPDPGLAHGLATQLLFGDTIAARQCELRDGELWLPKGPGLGVEIDDSALARLKI